MATSAPSFSFPGPIGTKRRRMRSGGNVSTVTNHMMPESEPDESADGADGADGGSAPPTAKCKATSIPIFLKKTYKMIESCDPSIASWTPDGEMFVVKDPDTFANQVIPQYFDHNKFSSFARQLNFYGFRKMQSKPIRNSDFDSNTAKHVTFFNENFKRGRCDLLKNIQRSTRGGGSTNQQDSHVQVQNLKDQVFSLEQKVADMEANMEERMRRLELDMLARMEQMMVAMQQQSQSQQFPLQSTTSIGSVTSNNAQNMTSTAPMGAPQQQGWDSNGFPRFHSIGTAAMQQTGNSVTFQQPEPRPNIHSGPTLPPHPKQKQLPMNILPPTSVAGVNRLNSLRGISALSRGLSGISRGASVESSASAVLMRNSWEDKFFSMLMLGENGEPVSGVDVGMVGPTPLAPGVTASNYQQMGQPATVSNGSMNLGMARVTSGGDDLLDVGMS